ncbi:MAG: hypothetical protein EXS67_00895 [Candidatus Margulisbacteria bacterium]|nr:hypothetical protein [Candidatus Margulisiibacteriota bacterium]
MKRKLLLTLLTWLILFATAEFAQVTFTFKGSLMRADKTFINGTYNNVKVGIYSDVDESVADVWSEIQNGVVFETGRFSILVGNVDPVANPLRIRTFNINLPHLGFTINGSEFFIPFTSTPYSMRTKVAEKTSAVSAQYIVGTFTKPVAIKSTLTITSGNTTLLKTTALSQVGIGKDNPLTKIVNGKTVAAAQLDVNGPVNSSSGFKLNGIDIARTLSWKQNAPITKNIYYASGNVGIGLQNPQYALDVQGTLNATQLLLKGKRLSAGLDWQHEVNASQNLYFKTEADNRVGIGRVDPQQSLDVNGSIAVSSNITDQTTPLRGMIRMSPTSNEIQGFRDNQWIQLTGLRGQGQKNQISFFTNKFVLSGYTPFSWKSQTNLLGIGTTSPLSQLHLVKTETLAPSLYIQTATNLPLLVVTSNGNIGVGTSNPNQKLVVKGTLNSEQLTVNGLDLSLAVSNSSVWILNKQSSLFYKLGNIGIGKIDPNSPLTIAQRVNHPDEDPAITFRQNSGNSYTMGISSKRPDIFRVERGDKLNTTTPLFVMKNYSFGTGLTDPLALLHVSGNEGAVFNGKFFGVIDETFPDVDSAGKPILPQVVQEGEGTRFIWHPLRAVLRAGTVTGNQWNNINLGKFSVAFGLNNTASGNFTTILGGKNNLATGAYSTILGGENNKAMGDFSLASGYRAKALHHGSFVWGDRSGTALSTIALNQFLVKVSNGVGIGTALTSIEGKKSTLTIKKVTPSGNIFQIVGKNLATDIFQVSTSGNAIIGSRSRTTAGLSVMGKTQFGNKQVPPTINSFLTISSESPTQAIWISNSNEDINTTPNFILTSSGNLGTNIIPLPDVITKFKNGTVQIGRGGILGNSYELPDGTKIGTKATEVWGLDAAPNVYFTTGNVGIGTTRPTSLLTISNVASKLFQSPKNPAITFSKNTTHYILGIENNVPDTLKMLSGYDLAQPSKLAFKYSENTLGRIGVGTENPRTVFHVNNPAILGKRVSIATTNTNVKYNLITGSASFRPLFLDKQFMSASGTPWTTTRNFSLYFTNGKIGIGTTAPTVALSIAGNIKATAVRIKDAFTVKETATLIRLDFLNPDGISLKLGVSASKLRLGDISISDILSRGNNTAQTKGPLLLWQSANIIGDTNLIWSSDSAPPHQTGTLTSTKNIRIPTTLTKTNSFQQTTLVQVGSANITNVLNVASDLTHNGNFSNSESHASQKITVNLEPGNWADPINTTQPIFTGLDIRIVNKANLSGATNFTTQAQAIGLNIDVSKINTQQTGEPGFNFAALFNGNVGINTFPSPTTPTRAILDIKGTVQADSFIISKRLSISTLNVTGDTLTIKQTRPIKIGNPKPTNPIYDLLVQGTVQATNGIIGTLESGALNAANGALLVNTSGQIGIGTTAPEGTFHIKKLFTTTTGRDYFANRVHSTVDILENPKKLTENLTGLGLNLNTKTNNKVGTPQTPQTATGLSINLSNMTSNDNGTVIGISSKTNKTKNQTKSAIFSGGNVGIGVTQPTDTLVVVGTIRAKAVDNTRLLTQQEAASFNRLVVTSNALFKGHVTANAIFATTIITKTDQLTINGSILLPSIALTIQETPGLLISRALSITANTKINALSLNEKLVGTAATFNKLTLTNSLTTTTLNILSLQASASIELNAAQANLNSHTIIASGKVGISITDATERLAIASDKKESTIFRAQNLSATKNTAAGILLVPDIKSDQNTGSGIAAIKVTAAGSNSPGSELAFITDPINGSPTERARLTQIGNFVIGTKNASSTLYVNQTSLIQGAATFNTKVTTKTLASASDIIIKKTTVFNNPTEISTLLTQKPIQIKLATLGTVTSGTSALSPSASEKLIYKTILDDNSVVASDITSLVTGSVGRLPYYNSSHRLTDNTSLTWATQNISSIPYSTLVIGKVSSGSMAIVTTFKNTLTGTPTAEDIQLTFKDRTSDISTFGERKFYGMQIIASKNTNASVAPGETARGLSVDLSTLKSESTTFQGNGTILKGTKYAALFNGGNVGIETISPNATLQIQPKDTITSLQIDTKTQAGTVITKALMVNTSGNTSIGATSNTKLTLKLLNTTSSDSTLLITDSNKNSLLALKNNNRIGIGNVALTTEFNVADPIKAKTHTARTLLANTLTINTDKLVVLTNGNVGIGNTNPQAQLHLIQKLTRQPASNFIIENLGLTVGGTPLRTTLTGLALTITSNAYNLLGFENTPNKGTGIKFSATSLALATTSTLVGINVNVPKGTSSNSTLIRGGNVGIGITNPSATLHIAGTLKVSGNILQTTTGNLSIPGVTANKLTSTGRNTFNTFKVRGSVKKVVITNRLIIKESSVSLLQKAPTTNFILLKSKTLARFTQASTGTSNIPSKSVFNIAAQLPTQTAMTLQKGTVIATNMSTLTTNRGLVTLTHDSSLDTPPIPALKIGTTVTPNALFVSNTGQASVGTSSSLAKLTIIEGSARSTAKALLITSSAGSPLLTALNNTTIGLGTKTPEALIHIVGQSTQPKVLKLASSVSENILTMLANGAIGIGITAPDSALQVQGTFKVSSVSTPNLISVSNAGNVGIWKTATANYPLYLDQNMRLGNSTDGTLPKYFRDQSRKNRGFITQTGSNHTFFGLRETVTGNSNYAPVIYWGSSNTDALTFETSAGLEAARLINKSVSIGGIIPSATLHISNINNTTAALLTLKTAKLPNLLTVTANGSIGIGIAPTINADVFVSGSIKAKGLKQPPGGTELTAPTINIVNSTTTYSSFSVSSNILSDHAQTAEAITLQLDKDSTGTLIGKSITLLSSVTQNNVNKLATTQHGLRVDISNLFIDKNPTFGDNIAQKFAAAFKGGNVGVGTKTPKTTFEVTTRKNAPGNIASFRATPNIIPGGSTPVKQADLTFTSYATVNISGQKLSVPTDSFKTIAYTLKNGQLFNGGNTFYVTDDIAKDIMSKLIQSNIIDPTTRNVLQTTKAALITAIGTGSSPGYFRDYITTKNVLSILLPFIEKHTIVLQHTDLSSAATSYNVLSFSSGLVARRPNIDSPVNTTKLLQNAFKFSGSVGIDVKKIDIPSQNTTLTVSGNIRIGTIFNTFSVEPVAVGPSLRFSGGYLVSDTAPNSDNKEAFSILRNNIEDGISQLRITVGAESTRPNALFTVGYNTKGRTTEFSGGSWKNVLNVLATQNGTTPVERVGIGTTTPRATLHIVGTGSFNELTDTPTNIAKTALALFENQSSSGAQTLAIKNSTEAGLTSEANFITFLSSTTNTSTIATLGSIEGNTDGGVKFTSPEGDYAEYILKENPQENLEPGTVVGIHKGTISKNTQGADQIMVISSSPIIVGNATKETHKNSAMVAFLGQVPINVTGTVNAGDLLIASGQNDGLAIALSANKITASQIDLILGRAWESSDQVTVKSIKSAIGFSYGLQIFGTQLSSIKTMTSNVKTLQKELAQKRKDSLEILEKRQNKINLLKEKIGTAIP